jgi:phenylalanyl-tRNA synthetase beta chain
LTYTFLSESLANTLGVADEGYVEVVNPVAEGESRVRRGLVPSLLGLIERNRRNRTDVRLFEVGKGYLPEDANERGEPREVHEVALVWAAPAPGKKARYDAGRLLQLRAVVDDLVSALGRGQLCWRRMDAEEGGEVPIPWLHAGCSMVACLPDGSGGERVVGLLGELEPGLHKKLGLTDELASDVAVARLSLDELVAIDASAGVGYRPLPKFPGVKVDVALSAPDGLPAGDLIAAIEKSGKGLVASCELFDLYRGESVGAGKKSLAFHVVLQSDKKTLSDKEGQQFLGRLERAATDLGAELRRQ